MKAIEMEKLVKMRRAHDELVHAVRTATSALRGQEYEMTQALFEGQHFDLLKVDWSALNRATR